MKNELTYAIVCGANTIGYTESRDAALDIIKILKKAGHKVTSYYISTRTIFESKEDFLKYLEDEGEEEA